MIGFIGLLAAWMTASSIYIIYGSFVAVFLVALLWGVLRVRRIQQIRMQREAQVEELKPDS